MQQQLLSLTVSLLLVALCIATIVLISSIANAKKVLKTTESVLAKYKTSEDFLLQLLKDMKIVDMPYLKLSPYIMNVLSHFIEEPELFTFENECRILCLKHKIHIWHYSQHIRILTNEVDVNNIDNQKTNALTQHDRIILDKIVELIKSNRNISPIFL